MQRKLFVPFKLSCGELFDTHYHKLIIFGSFQNLELTQNHSGLDFIVQSMLYKITPGDFIQQIDIS